MQVAYGSIRVDGCEREVAYMLGLGKNVLVWLAFGWRTYFGGCVGKAI